MTNQSNTTVRELSPEDLDRVSGAGIKVPDAHGGKPPGSDASLQFEPNAASRGVIAPEV